MQESTDSCVRYFTFVSLFTSMRFVTRFQTPPPLSAIAG